MFGGWGQVNNASRLFYHPNDVVCQHCHNPNIHVVRMKYPERCILGGFGCQNHTQCIMFGGLGQVNNASRLFYHPNDVI